MPWYHSGEVRLHYEERAARGVAGRSALLVHGWCGSGAGWADLVARLPDDYAALAPDLRGTGSSDRPASGYTVEQYAADVHALVVARDLRAIDLIGNSMGGAVALTLALDHPDRIRSLTLVSPVPADGLPGGGPDSVDVRRKARTDRETARWMAAAYHARPPSELAVDQGAKAIMAASDGHYWDSLTSMERLRLLDRMASLHVPTLIIGGVADRVVPPEALVRMWRALPDAGLHLFRGVGHAVRSEAPDAFYAALDDFLSRRGE